MPNPFIPPSRRAQKARPNPLLSKRGKQAVLGDIPVREMSSTAQELEENIFILGPMGPVGSMLGYHPTTHILYFLIDPADREDFIRHIMTEPLFYSNYRAIAGPGTLEAFWKKRITQKLASAVQFYLDADTLVITHMQTKPAWRRQGLNTLLINYIKEIFPHKEIVFHEPTDQGRAFMQGRGYVR